MLRFRFSPGHTAAMLLLAAGALTRPGMARAQREPLARILSVVDDSTGQPIAGAEVIATATGDKATTSAAGMAALALRESGAAMLKIRKTGYAESQLSIAVSPADTGSITIRLKPLSQALAGAAAIGAATASGQTAEAERRRLIGFGHVLTHEQLVQHQGSRMSEVMTLLNGVVIKFSAVDNKALPGGAYVVTQRGHPAFRNQNSTSRHDCLAAIMIDGTFVYSGLPGELPFDVNALSPADFASIEFYSGGATMPPEFNGTRNACGVVAMWTTR
jgi:hypothetical protein